MAQLGIAKVLVNHTIRKIYDDGVMAPSYPGTLRHVLPGTTSWYLSSEPENADAQIREGMIELVTLGRPFLVNPHWPYRAAKELNDNPSWATLPAPYAHWVARYR